GIVGQSNIVGDEIRLSNKLEICLYRIAQEATNNIIKHSRATNFSIEILVSTKKVRLMITDNGIGFNYERITALPGNTKGMGLVNMKERVKNFNGQFKVESSPEKGTMIVTEIPLKKENVWQNQDQYA
ncbi:MAG: ATP-binding protein, partial [Bacteroidota bacterium]